MRQDDDDFFCSPRAGIARSLITSFLGRESLLPFTEDGDAPSLKAVVFRVIADTLTGNPCAEDVANGLTPRPV
jgi:hypothetical protein